MASLQERYSEDFLRKKMKKWLGIKETDEVEYHPIMFTPSTVDTSYDIDSFILSNSLLTWVNWRETVDEEDSLKTRVNLLESRCRTFERKSRIFERKIQELERQQGIRREPTKSELIYVKHKDELEQKYFGKIVAIDNDSEEIVGIGDTILEAYKEARKKSTKDKFSYHKVGFDYVHKL